MFPVFLFAADTAMGSQLCGVKMSAIIEFLQYIVAEVLGEAVGGLLFPATNEPPPSEGIWNASLGTVSIFIVGLAAMFGAAGIITLVHPDTNPPEAWWAYALSLGCAALAWVAFRLGRRTLIVTRRRHMLAWTAIVLAVATILSCVGTVTLITLR